MAVAIEFEEVTKIFPSGVFQLPSLTRLSLERPIPV